MSRSRRAREDSQAGAILASGVLLGSLLGAVVGVTEASRQVQPVVKVSAPDQYTVHTGETSDADHHDRFAAWPLLGLTAGGLIGGGTSRLYLRLRRSRNK
jgi:hypothetical protein